MTECVLTFDIDWSPDFVIDFVADQLIAHRVKATWFVTHASPAIERLRQHQDLFEMGIHPNFLTGSTHGATHEVVLDRCMKLVPEAITMRSHGLVQSTPLLEQVLMLTPIRIDVSLFLPHAPFLCPVKYFWKEKKLTRVPFFWEDDFEMQRDQPIWELKLLLDHPGLKVFSFHPLHVYLGAPDLSFYTSLKETHPNMLEVTPEELKPQNMNGLGPRSLFEQLIDVLAKQKPSHRISDIALGEA